MFEFCRLYNVCIHLHCYIVSSNEALFTSHTLKYQKLLVVKSSVFGYIVVP
jgi:hypothetical protein